MPEVEYLQFGGLAVVEGVMMRSPHFFAVACRAPNGEIVVKTEPLAKTWIGRQEWLKKPFLRGSLAMLDTMVLGNRAMKIASNVQLDTRFMTEAEKADFAKSGKAPEQISPFMLIVAVIISLATGFLLFRVVPEATAQFLRPGSKDKIGIGTNILAELIKLVFFIGYLSLLRRLPLVLEVFKYHGAEHKAINTIEASEPLDPDHAMAQTRLHPRCGTNFAIIVILLGWIIFPFVPRFGQETANPIIVILIRVLIELVVLPIIAGIAYEIIRAAGRAKNKAWVNILLKPGLMTQYITTEEPAVPHIEVAIASLQAVMEAEETGKLRDDIDPVAPAVAAVTPA